jgi:hypothetical protein
LIIRIGTPNSVPAESKAALCFIVYFARVKTRKRRPCFWSTLRALSERHSIWTKYSYYWWVCVAPIRADGSFECELARE